MKERPILFSGPMVRAILDGRKTQTRRIVKPQPISSDKMVFLDGEFLVGRMRDSENAWRTIHCFYGQPSDRLWVRETWCRGKDKGLLYKADMQFDWGHTWKPSIHMPRWASRISLEIFAVRVERLQSISAEDAQAEGIHLNIDEVWHWQERNLAGYSSPRQAYCELWESINGPGSWDANPWVWVVEFKRVMPEAKG